MDALEQILETNPIYEPVSRRIPEEAIRERAYAIYVLRGMEDGRAEEDWLEAEIELRNEGQAHE